MNDEDFRKGLLIGLEYSYLHDSWVHPLAEALEGVGAQEAIWRAGADSKCIWDIVLHLALWNKNIVERIESGEAVFPPGHVAWPPPPASPSEADWEIAKKRLWDSLDALKAYLETVPMAKIEAMPYGFGDLLCRFIHNGYHIGQIVKMREMKG